MHLLVPFASDGSEACQHVLRDLSLPNLGRLLSMLEAGHRDGGDATSFSLPHERALAAAWGWRGGDGALPFAAHAAAGDGVAVGTRAWGLLTPAHWQLGRDHVALLDPASLDLGDAESRALFGDLAELLGGDGFVAAWGSAGRWYVARDDLAGLATASLDRVVGRSVDAWLRERPSVAAPRAATAGQMRRLQSEAQLLFHSHSVNEAREERGALPVNSFWLSGCGVAQHADATATPTLDTTLRAPLLAGDWAAWAEAWQGLDAGAIASLLAAATAGTTTTLTLCGERSAARFESRPRPLWKRVAAAWHKTEPHIVLASL